jgi:endonuclease III related protein
MSTLQEYYDALFAHYGPQDWWPAETPFEVLVGAVLVQNTAWTNVARAIEKLKAEGLLDPHALYALPEDELAEKIRSTGFFRLKAKRLRNVLKVLVERFDGSMDAMFETDPIELRSILLAVNGVGPETVDSILLYAGGVPSFVIDAYTRRILLRHGVVSSDETGYELLQSRFESELPKDAQLYNEYHGLLVRVAKEQCKKRTVQCEDCPLRDLLSKSGPIED